MVGLTLDRLAVIAAVSSWYFIAGGVFILVLVILGTVILPQIRKRYHPSNVGGSGEGSAFDIDSLERMRSQGLLSPEEFRKLRLAALGLDTKVSKHENSASSAPMAHDDEESAKRADGPAGPEGTDEEEDGPQEEL